MCHSEIAYILNFLFVWFSWGVISFFWIMRFLFEVFLWKFSFFVLLLHFNYLCVSVIHSKSLTNLPQEWMLLKIIWDNFLFSRRCKFHVNSLTFWPCHCYQCNAFSSLGKKCIRWISKALKISLLNHQII